MLESPLKEPRRKACPSNTNPSKINSITSHKPNSKKKRMKESPMEQEKMKLSNKTDHRKPLDRLKTGLH